MQPQQLDIIENTRTKDSQAGIITDKSKEAFSYTYLINTEEFQPYDAYRIKVQRLSPVNQKENSWQQTNGSQLKSIENIITDKLRYPYTAYAGVIVDAEDFSQIPKRGYEIFGMKVKVPTNYFPRLEHYRSRSKTVSCNLYKKCYYRSRYRSI